MTFYDQVLVLEAFVLTVATTMALTMYTLQSKKDYSSWGAGYVLVTMGITHATVSLASPIIQWPSG